MRRILYSILTITVGLVLSGSSCNTETNPKDDPTTTDVGVKIGEVIWATRNVCEPGKFVAKPEDPGKFYQWNSDRAWSGTGATIPGWDATMPTGADWAAENDPCPEGWRVPTETQMTALIADGYVWDNTKKQGTFGVGAHTILIPAAGCLNYEDGVLSSTEAAYYWISTSEVGAMGIILAFSNGTPAYVGGFVKSFGCPIRCVKK